MYVWQKSCKYLAASIAEFVEIFLSHAKKARMTYYHEFSPACPVSLLCRYST